MKASFCGPFFKYYLGEIHVTIYSVEANAVIDVVKNDLWRVVKSFIYPGYGVLYFLKSLFGLIEVNRELACMSVYPNSGLTFQFVKFFRRRRHSNGCELLELPGTLVHYDHACRTRFVLSTADKHIRKVTQGDAIHPENFIKNWGD